MERGLLSLSVSGSLAKEASEGVTDAGTGYGLRRGCQSQRGSTVSRVSSEPSGRIRQISFFQSRKELNVIQSPCGLILAWKSVPASVVSRVIFPPFASNKQIWSKPSMEQV